MKNRRLVIFCGKELLDDEFFVNLNFGSFCLGSNASGIAPYNAALAVHDLQQYADNTYIQNTRKEENVS